MYVSNESPTLVEVYFDDVTMTLTPSNVIQYNEYYPFGLQTANSWTRPNTTGNNFLANGGTELNTTSQLYDLEYRNYDPVLGRMNGVDPMANKYSSLTPYNYSFNNPVTFNDPSGAEPWDDGPYGGNEAYYYAMHMNEDGRSRDMDPGGGGGGGTMWHSAGSQSYRGFGHSMSFGLSKYSVEYQRGIVNDIYRMSNSDYAKKYGAPISVEQTMALQGQYNRAVYAQSYDLQIGVAGQLFQQRNTIPSLSPTKPQQSLFDQIDLNEFVNFYFAREFDQVSEKFKLVIGWDFLGLTTTKKPGNTTPVWNKSEIQILLNPSIQKNWKLLYSVIGHEIVHAMDISNGNLRFWNRMVNGNYEKLEALMEFHAYQWSLSAEKGMGVNFGGQNGYLEYQGLLGYFGIKFGLPPP